MVYDYCEEHYVSSIECLYAQFGTPSEIANSYFATVDTDYIIKKLRLTKCIKAVAFGIFVISLSLGIFFTLYLLHGYKVMTDQQVVFIETTID